MSVSAIIPGTMEKLVIVAVLVNLITLSLGKYVQNSVNIDCPNALERFTDSLLHVSANFLKYYSNSTSETWAVAPIASMYNIAALALFAKGMTKTETYTTLNVTSREEIVYIFNILNEEVSNLPDCVTYRRATIFFGNLEIPFTPEFKGNMSKIIDGLAKNVNFFYPKHSTDKINKIVASQTGNRITNIIEDGTTFNESSQIILVTGIYLKGIWEIGFHRTSEVNQFRVLPSKSESQTFMFQEGTYKYGHSAILGAEVVQINFCCELFHLWIVLPDCPFKENDVIDKMTEDNNWYYELRDTMNLTRIKLFIPNYNISTITVDSQERFVETTGVGTIYDEETVDLKGVIENDKTAVVSTCIEKVEYSMSYDGEKVPDRSLSNGTKRTFTADFPHIFIIFCKSERVYLTGVFRKPVS